MITTMSLRTRVMTLVAGFVVMALAIMGFGLVSLSDYDRMMGDYGRAYENAYMGERLNHMITASLMESRGLYLARSHDEEQQAMRNIEVDLIELQTVAQHWQDEKIAPADMHLDSLFVRIKGFLAWRYDMLHLARTQSKHASEELGRSRRADRVALQKDIDRVVNQTRQTLAAAKTRAETFRQQRTIEFVLATLAWIGITALLIVWVISHFITREITRIRVEEEHREKLLKQLVETNTELERFAYVASHDMQEPVRMVNIYSQMIATDYDARLDDTGRRYLGVVTSAAARMHRLVQDLLQYSRLQHDHSRHEAVDLNEQLNHVRGNFTRLIEDTGARIEAGPLPEVVGNPVQIQRLLANLINNAIKYQRPGEVPVIKINATDLGEQWQVAVQDNGLGVEPQFAMQIFEPFRRLHTWDQHEGTGIGLAICRKIVERHGGRIWVESQPGEGACFCFTLPKAIYVAQPEDVRAVA